VPHELVPHSAIRIRSKWLDPSAVVNPKANAANIRHGAAGITTVKNVPILWMSDKGVPVVAAREESEAHSSVSRPEDESVLGEKPRLDR
jgi:hypothetical protein